MGCDGATVMPAGDPWQKTSAGRTVTDASHRLEMSRLAFGRIGGVSVSSAEASKDGPTYTMDTVAALRDSGHDVVLLIGQDAAAGLGSWHRAEDLRQSVILAVPQYRGEPPMRIAGWTTAAVSTERLACSSTSVRRNLSLRRSSAACAAAAYRFLAEPVTDYIEHHGLYLPEGQRRAASRPQ